MVTAGTLGDGGYTGHVEKEVHIPREGFRNGDKGMGGGRVKIAGYVYVSPGSGLSPVQHEGGATPDAYTVRTACRVRQFAAVTQFQCRLLAGSQNHAFILPVQCHVFAQRNPAVVNSYRGAHILSVQIDIGEFDINGIVVGVGIAEEVVVVAVFPFPGEGVAAAVYLEVTAAIHGRGVVVTSRRYRDVGAQRDECRSVGRGAARLQGVEQGVVCGDGDTFRHGLRYRIVLAARSKDYCCT